MNYPELRNIMIGIAVITPVLAALVLMIGRAGAAHSDEPLPRSMKRNALLLAIAGPLNLVLWLFFNVWHDRQGPGSVFGMVAAAIVFIAAGFGTGLFARLMGRK